MPPQRKSAYFQPTVPIPPQTILSLETELTHFRPRRSLLLETELRPFSLRNHAHPYQYPISRRGGTPEKDCLDWSQYPLTPAVAAAIRHITDTTSVPPPPPPDPTRARSRQPTPGPGQPRSRQPTPARQPTPGPSTTATGDSAELPSRPLLRRAKSVRFPTGGDDDDDEGQGQQEDKIATPELDGLISRPPGEVGRRGRGGFSLEVVLGWTTERFETVKKLVKSYVEDYLNHSMSMSNQPRGHVNSLIKLVSGTFLNIVVVLTPMA